MACAPRLTKAFVALALGGVCCHAVSQSPDRPPTSQDTSGPIVETLLLGIGDWMRNRGGAEDGSRFLSRVEARSTLDFGAKGLVVIDVGGANGRSVSALSGDIQGPSNIEALKALRVYNLFYQAGSGKSTADPEQPRSIVRAGVMDLNAHFYVQGDAAATFLNSSHSIGPEMSRSGRNGPSVDPDSGLGIVAEQVLSKMVSVRVGLFDGAPNDPDHSRRTSLKLSPGEGGLLVSELGYGGLTLGGWAYTARQDRLDGTGAAPGNGGVYTNLNGDLGKDLQGWVTIGKSSSRFNDVDNYLGAGAMHRLNSTASIGIALASARVTGFGREHNVEVTAPLDLGGGFLLQPDFQYIRHPSARSGSARVFGLRLSYTYRAATASRRQHPLSPDQVLRKKPVGSGF